MTPFKMAYINKSALSVIAWIFLVAPVIYAFYALLSAGKYLETPEMIQIAASLALSLLSFMLFKGISSSILRRRENILEEIYTDWAPKAGVRTLDEDNENFEQSVIRTVRAEWIGRTSKMASVRLDGNTAMDAENLKGFLKFLNTKAPKKQTYVLDLSEINEGDVLAYLSEKGNIKSKIVDVRLMLLDSLKSLLPINSTPNIEFSDSFKKNGKVLDSFLLTKLSEPISPRNYRNIEKKVQETFPAVNGAQWLVEPVSNSVIKLQQTKSDDPRENESIINLLGKSATASLQVAGSYAITDDVEIFSIINGVPTDFDVIFRNEDDLKDIDTLTKVAKSFIRILNSKFGGEWKVSNEIENGRLGLTKVS